MSRSGYSDDIDDRWSLIRWRGAVESAIRGKRGQAFLREMLVALNAVQEKGLVTNELITATGEVCALGAVAVARGLDVKEIDPEDRETVAAKFEIAPALACEIMFLNDEGGPHKESPWARWFRIRTWVQQQIRYDR